MIEKPPKWRDRTDIEFIKIATQTSGPIYELLKKANKEYVYWDKFKYYPFPENIPPEDAWAALKFTRLSDLTASPLKSIEGDDFSYKLTANIQQGLSYVDTQCAGNLQGGDNLINISKREKSRLILSGLSEEAIASSQIEGASTSRKVAKNMIVTKRQPKTKDELMIMNNYLVMEALEDWKDLELSEKMLLDLQSKITSGTLDDAEDTGRFRKDEDEIRVFDRKTGEVIFTPPLEKMMRKELARLIEYANTDKGDFVHPVTKACILHFWIAYLHPFVDGNGRTARAIFYWFLLKKNYWLFKYLSVSRVIKKSRKKYDRSFLYTEHDENDLTYFLEFQIKVIAAAIDDFLEHLERKRLAAEEIKKLVALHVNYNERQLELINKIHERGSIEVDISSYQIKNTVAYETARSDLQDLVSDGILQQQKVGKKFVFRATREDVKKLFKGMQ